MLLYIIAQAAADPTGVSGFLDYLNLGVIVVVVVGLIKGWIVPKYVVDSIKEDRDNEKDEKDRLRERLDTEVFPQLWKTTDLLAEFADRDSHKGEQ